MIKIKYKVGGRTFTSSRDAARELGRQVQKNFQNAVSKHVSSVRCPVHGQVPCEIGRDSAGIRYSFCCEVLKAAAFRSIR
jgi:hypothetical protein